MGFQALNLVKFLKLGFEPAKPYLGLNSKDHKTGRFITHHPINLLEIINLSMIVLAVNKYKSLHHVFLCYKYLDVTNKYSKYLPFHLYYSIVNQ